MRVAVTGSSDICLSETAAPLSVEWQCDTYTIALRASLSFGAAVQTLTRLACIGVSFIDRNTRTRMRLHRVAFSLDSFDAVFLCFTGF